MNIFYINATTQKFDYVDPDTGIVDSSVANGLKVISIDRYYDCVAPTLITMETYENGSTRTFQVKAAVLQLPQLLYSELLKNGYFIQAGLVKLLRYYLTDEIIQLQHSGQVNFMHKSLGFYDDSGKLEFLYDTNKLKLGTSEYFKDDFEFKNGLKTDYIKFLKKEILPNQLSQLALVLGLSSVISSYLKDYADVGTILVNLSGRSSTGKTTMSQFMASLWANPRISNSGLVKTFNSTEIAKLASIEGYNGIPIIFDDATTLGAGNKSKLIYQLAEGESRARSSNYGTEIAQGLTWSGLALITSENPILDDSDVRLGLRARVLDFDDIVWTIDGPHAKRIKSFIFNNYGHVGKEFANKIIKLPYSDITTKYDKVHKTIEAGLTDKDDISNRITNKLAIVQLTAELIKSELGFSVDTAFIQKSLIDLDQKDVRERHPSIIALEVIKHYVVKHHRKFEKQDEEGNRLLYTSGDLIGIMKFAPTTVEVHIPSKFVKDILRQNRIYDYKAILKGWGDRELIIKQGERHTAVTNKLDTRAVRFVFEQTEDSIIPWDYPLAKVKKTPSEEPPKHKDDFSASEDDIKKIFEEIDDESKD